MALKKFFIAMSMLMVAALPCRAGYYDDPLWYDDSGLYFNHGAVNVWFIVGPWGDYEANYRAMTSLDLPLYVDWVKDDWDPPTYYRDRVAGISYKAFSGYTNLKSVTVPDAMLMISGFDGCTALESFRLSHSGLPAPDPQTYFEPGAAYYYEFVGIDSWSFNGCTSLREMEISPYISRIGECTFNDCISLPSITLPEAIKEINNQAFHGCSSLKDVYALPANPPVPCSISYYERNGVHGVTSFCGLHEYAFDEWHYENTVLHVRAESVEKYRQAKVWKRFQHIVGDVEPAKDKNDLNGDGAVNVGDVNVILADILEDGTTMSYDVNGDGEVNVGDVNVILEAILSTANQ